MKERELTISDLKRKTLTRQIVTESTVRGRTNDMQSAPLALLPSVDQCRSGIHNSPYRASVFVVDRNQKALMPTTPNRAESWIKSGKATPFWKKGIFCVRLNQEPSARHMQKVAIGIDPGSKKEGFTIKSKAHTYLNIQADAVTHVKDAIESRRNMRRTRRNRKTPCRQNRTNRSRGSLPPSTKARWDWKLRIVTTIKKICPITDIVVEDIKAKTKAKPTEDKWWNRNFSPLQTGKEWFYSRLKTIGKVHLKSGLETATLRAVLGLKKDKTTESFYAHCVDSWVLAHALTGGQGIPENTSVLYISPIRLHRRQLHVFQPAKEGIRKLYGGTRSRGFKRGSLVRHPKYGLTYVGGTSKNRISLHSITDGKRLAQNVNPSDVKFKTFNTWRTHLLPALKDGVSGAQIF